MVNQGPGTETMTTAILDENCFVVLRIPLGRRRPFSTGNEPVERIDGRKLHDSAYRSTRLNRYELEAAEEAGHLDFSVPVRVRWFAKSQERGNFCV